LEWAVGVPTRDSPVTGPLRTKPHLSFRLNSKEQIAAQRGRYQMVRSSL
jgi:hypothetical protein